MSKPTIYLCDKPTDTCWQLGAELSKEKEVLLIGWTMVSEDGGVPNDIVSILSESLATIGRVSFPISLESTELGIVKEKNLTSQPLHSSGMKGIMERLFTGIPKYSFILSSSKPEVIEKTFNAAYFSWEMQSTVATLSDSKKPVPTIDIKTLKNLVDNKSWIATSKAIQSDIIGILKPGTDGSVAGLLFFSNETKAAFVRVIRSTASKYGIEVMLVEEEDFKK